jgi:hypothetical protein
MRLLPLQSPPHLVPCHMPSRIRGLHAIHEHLLPISRALERVEGALHRPVTLAQALLLVQDQAALHTLAVPHHRLSRGGEGQATRLPTLQHHSVELLPVRDPPLTRWLRGVGDWGAFALLGRTNSYSD